MHLLNEGSLRGAQLNASYLAGSRQPRAMQLNVNSFA